MKCCLEWEMQSVRVESSTPMTMVQKGGAGAASGCQVSFRGDNVQGKAKKKWKKEILGKPWDIRKQPGHVRKSPLFGSFEFTYTFFLGFQFSVFVLSLCKFWWLLQDITQAENVH